MLTPISDRRYLIPFRSQLLPAIFAARRAAPVPPTTTTARE